MFYSEGRGDWPHLGPIVEELTGSLDRRLAYVTSDQDDPVFSLTDDRIRAFFIGSGGARTTFFRLVEADVVVMTLPDLETFHLKRSVHPVHYAYVFHSIASTHMVYRKGAFDAYDTILCVGPHHMAEVRRTEEIYGLRPKELAEHGYARLDRILRTASDRPPHVPGPGPARRIVLAPSWGECSFAEARVGEQLIELLLGAGQEVALRLHPMTVRRFPRLAPSLAGRFGDAAFRVVTDMNEQASLQDSDLMISDWSGAAFDYAFGLERPVLFVDMPKKVTNPEYTRLGLPPIEESVREELGGVIALGELGAVLERVETLTASADRFRSHLREVRERSVYNVGRSAQVGAAHVARLADAARTRAVAGAPA